MVNRSIPLGRIVHFLTDIKSELICDFHDNETVMLGGCGPLVVTMYIDATVDWLLSMQTEIEELRSYLRIKKQTVEDYETVFGELEDWTEEELQTALEIKGKHECDEWNGGDVNAISK